MHPDPKHPHAAIADQATGNPPSVDVPDVCSDQPARQDDTAAASVAPDHRQAEILFHGGDCDAALEYCRRAVAEAPDDAAMLQVCAWVFSNSGCLDEAASAYCSLLRLRPDWIEGHRHASGALAAGGRLDDAIVHAIAACSGAPGDAEFARHAGGLLLAAQRPAEAAPYLEQAATLQPDNPKALGALSKAYRELDRDEEAIALASRAAALAPGDTNLAVDAAEMLFSQGRAKDAAELLRQAAARATPAVAEARLWRALSTAEILQDRVETALAAVDRAIEAAPDAAEYHLHRGHLLWRLGDLGGTAAAFARAAALDPASRDLSAPSSACSSRPGWSARRRRWAANCCTASPTTSRRRKRCCTS